jgi:hypothetical protein
LYDLRSQPHDRFSGNLLAKADHFYPRLLRAFELADGLDVRVSRVDRAELAVAQRSQVALSVVSSWIAPDSRYEDGGLADFSSGEGREEMSLDFSSAAETSVAISRNVFESQAISVQNIQKVQKTRNGAWSEIWI